VRTFTAPPAVLAVVLSALLGSFTPVLGQASRVGETQFPMQGFVRFPTVAYEETNDVYLVGYGLGSASLRFVSAAGTPLGAPAQANTSGLQVLGTRVVCAPAPLPCLFVWMEEPDRIVGRLVKYGTGGTVSFVAAPFEIYRGGMKFSGSAPAVAYSSASGGEFLVVWTDWPLTLNARRVSVAGAPVGAVIPIGSASRLNYDPAATYNSATNEYVVVYEAEGSWSEITAQRIKPGTGALLGSAALYSGTSENYPQIAYNPESNEYLVSSWDGTFPWFVHGRRVRPDLTPVSGVLTLATQAGGQGLGLAYNTNTNTYLGVHQHPLTDQIFGMTISSAGVPSSQFLVMTVTAQTPEPQAAASTRTGRWLSVASAGFKAAATQLMQGSEGASAPPPAVPVSPTGSINTATPTYTWRAAAGATFYYLWVTDSNGTPKVQSWYSAASACSGTTCTASPGTALAAGNATWWVQTWNPNGYGPWSSGMTFNVGRITPTAISPSGTVSSSPILFTWSAVPGATLYYLWVNDQTGVKFQSWIQASVACVPGEQTCSVNAAPSLFAGPGVWWVEAWSPGVGYSPWSAPRSFTIAPFTQAPQLLAPTGGLNGSSIEFSWLAAPGATHYYLWVNDSNGPRLQQWYQASQVCSGTLCFLTASPSLAAGVGTWWVQGFNTTGGYGPWSSPLTFVR
jgi:hypothetical protein